MKQQLVVIGNGMAGMRTVEELTGLAPDLYDVTVFGSEPHGNYNRILLTPVLFGTKTIDEIMIHDFAWYRKHKILLYCGAGKTVTGIDRRRKIVSTEDGTRARYDKLLIATGSRPSILPIPGNDTDGVMGFRAIADVDAMIEKAQRGRHAIVLGGGLLGIEAANGLKQRGMQVTVINRAEHLLNRQLDKRAGAFLQKQLERTGLKFRLGTTIQKIASSAGHIARVILDNGEVLPADILIMATGIKPNIALAEKAGLKCDQGIEVDDSMQTSDPDVFAVGECIQHRGKLFGLVAPVYEQAKICAAYLSRQHHTHYQPLTSATMLKVTGIDLCSAGNFEGDASTEQISLIDPGLSVYKKLVLKSNIIVGMILYGDTTDNAWYLDLIKNETDVSSFRDQLIFGQSALSEEV